MQNRTVPSFSIPNYLLHDQGAYLNNCVYNGGVRAFDFSTQFLQISRTIRQLLITTRPILDSNEVDRNHHSHLRLVHASSCRTRGSGSGGSF